MRYLTLSSEERRTLEESVNNHKKHHFRDRCRSILMSGHGYQIKTIADLFKVHTRTIYSWFDRWEEKGIVGPMVKLVRGIQAKLDHPSEAEIPQVKASIKANP